MRLLFGLAAAAFAAFSAAAFAAGPAVIAPLAVAPDFQTKLAKDYGERELEELSGHLNRRLDAELKRVGVASAGGAPLTIAVTIEDAKPNKPTFKQLGDEVGLSYSLSFGVGGAALSAEIKDADGRVLQTVRYDWYETDIRQAEVSSTWTDARRAISRFARLAAEAYAEAAAATPAAS
jgi:hypothetical protein